MPPALASMLIELSKAGNKITVQKGYKESSDLDTFTVS